MTCDGFGLRQGFEYDTTNRKAPIGLGRVPSNKRPPPMTIVELSR